MVKIPRWSWLALILAGGGCATEQVTMRAASVPSVEASARRHRCAGEATERCYRSGPRGDEVLACLRSHIGRCEADFANARWRGVTEDALATRAATPTRRMPHGE